METLLINHGFTALFILSFLAATVIPVGSEWLLIALIVKSFNAEQAVCIATAGNYLGACTTYVIGLWGSAFLVKKILRMDESHLAKATSFYEKYGAWALLLSWLPIIGDSLCLIGLKFDRVRSALFGLVNQPLCQIHITFVVYANFGNNIGC